MAEASGDLPGIVVSCMASHAPGSSRAGGGAGTAEVGAVIGRRAAGLLFNGIELSDPTDGLPGDGGALRPVDIDRLASDMGHAGDLADGTGAMQILEPGATIGMQPTAEAGEAVLRMPALSVTREAI